MPFRYKYSTVLYCVLFAPTVVFAPLFNVFKDRKASKSTSQSSAHWLSALFALRSRLPSGRLLSSLFTIQKPNGQTQEISPRVPEVGKSEPVGEGRRLRYQSHENWSFSRSSSTTSLVEDCTTHLCIYRLLAFCFKHTHKSLRSLSIHLTTLITRYVPVSCESVFHIFDHADRSL